MANVTIGDLTAATSIDGTELLEIQQSGVSKRVSASDIAALTPTGGGGGTGNDANDNYSANNFLRGVTTIVSAGTTTTLTVASSYEQRITGSTTQTIKLPVVSTLAVGTSFLIRNLSSGTVSVQSSGLNTVALLTTNTAATVSSNSTSGTSALSWDIISNADVLTLASIDNTSYDATSWDGDTTHAPSKNAVRDKIEAMAVGSASVSDAAYDATTWDGVTTISPSKNAVRDKIEALIAGGGAGDALTSNPLSQFAATTSAQLKGVISDETGSGLLVFATTPTLTTPILGTPTSGNLGACTVDGTNLLGYRGIPQNSQTAAYTTILTDAGKCIFHPSSDNNARTFTIDSNANVAYPIGTVIEFMNMAATASTIAITSDTMTLLPAGTTGSRTLAQYGRANAEKISATAWVISGNSALT